MLCRCQSLEASSRMLHAALVLYVHSSSQAGYSSFSTLESRRRTQSHGPEPICQFDGGTWSHLVSFSPNLGTRSAVIFRLFSLAVSSILYSSLSPSQRSCRASSRKFGSNPAFGGYMMGWGWGRGVTADNAYSGGSSHARRACKCCQLPLPGRFESFES